MVEGIISAGHSDVLLLHVGSTAEVLSRLKARLYY